MTRAPGGLIGLRTLEIASHQGSALVSSAANSEFLVGNRQHRFPISSLPFVHTARRFNRLSAVVNLLSLLGDAGEPWCLEDEEVVTRYP